jgi:hypothetical protein
MVTVREPEIGNGSSVSMAMRNQQALQASQPSEAGTALGKFPPKLPRPSLLLTGSADVRFKLCVI